MFISLCLKLGHLCVTDLIMFDLNKHANILNNFSEDIKQMYLVIVYIMTGDRTQ